MVADFLPGEYYPLGEAYQRAGRSRSELLSAFLRMGVRVRYYTPDGAALLSGPQFEATVMGFRALDAGRIDYAALEAKLKAVWGRK